MRQLAILIGIGLCVIGIVFSPLWLIGVGVLCLIASSFLPDKPLPFMSLTQSNSEDGDAGTQSTKISLSRTQQLALGSLLLIGTAVIGTNNNVLAIWPLPVWVVGLAMLFAAGYSYDKQFGVWETLTNKWQQFRGDWYTRPEIYAVLVLTIIGAVLRIQQLEQLPPMHGDEGEMGLRALELLGSDTTLAPFATDFLDHPTLFHYLQALSIVVFGQTVSGLRMISVIFGVLCIPTVYVAGRLSYSRLVGLTAAGFLTFSHVHIHFSRIGLNNIHSVFMGILVFVLVLWCARAMRSENGQNIVTPWLAVGVFTGLAQYFYFGSRLIPFLLIFWFAILWWQHRQEVGWGLWRKLALIPIGFLAAWVPLVPRFIKVPVTLISRQSGVSVFNPRNITAVLGEGATTTDILMYQLQRNIRFFIDSGDVSSFYFSGVPGLGTLAAILFWVGFGLALAQFMRKTNALLLGWFVIGVALGGILTNTSPAATRLVMVYPAIALMCGVAVETIVGMFQSDSEQNYFFELAIVAVICIGLGSSGIRTYFQIYAFDPPQSHMVKMGKDFAERADDAELFLMGDPILYARHGTILYLNQENTPSDLRAVEELLDFEFTKPNLFFIAVPPREAEFRRIVEAYPGGELGQVNTQPGRLQYFTYEVARP